VNFSLTQTVVLSLCTAVLATNVSISAFAMKTNEATVAVNSLSNNISVAKNILMKKLTTIKYFSADFTQQVLDADGNVLQNASGTLAVKKPNLVHWNTAEPDESLIVSDGSTLWYFNPFVEQVSAFRLDKALMNTPILLLTSSDPELWQHYSVSTMNENNFLIHANDNNSQVKTLELRFKKSTNELDSFTILDATGQLNFTIPEGIELDDQR
jgi:outer membrane lipoprotein carrier protein